MNTTTPSGPEGFSNWTDSWINNSPADIQNSTRALASTIGKSGTLTYEWTTYIITAICLVLTLPLSLTIGSILRTVYRSTAYYATYWRAFIVLPSLAFIFWIICNGLLFLYLVLRVFRAWKNQRRRLFWIVLLIFTTLSGFADWAVDKVPIMLFPWLSFALIWLRPYWMRWKQEKARKQDATTEEVELTPILASTANQTVNVINTDSIHSS